MENINIGGSGLVTSAIVAGCMRISKMSQEDASRFVNTALDNGINMFDHADIYGGGKSEEVFAQAVGMNPTVREKLFIQDKCSIRKGFFDCSKEYILQSVDGMLKRLNTEYLDMLLIHRPDSLMEPEEIASAFDVLESSGKVRKFGISNQNSMQIELISKYVKQKLVANQLQLSIAHTGMIDSGINVNMRNDSAMDRDGNILEYCRLKDITIQAWSPLQYGFFEGTFLGHEKFPEINRVLDRIAADRGVASSAVAIAWILRHPAKMQVIVGTTNSQRLAEMSKACDVKLTREEWYEIYRSAGNILP
jgi:predicted oxidoreductase